MSENATNTNRRTNPETLNIIKRLMSREYGSEHVEEVKKVCGDISAENPASANFYLMRAVASFIIGDKANAEIWMEKASLLAPRSPLINYIYAIILLAQNRSTVALLLLMRVVTLNPEHVKAYCHIGHALRSRGQLDDALTALTQALVINPNDINAWNGKGIILRDMNRLSEAAACFRQALIHEPDHPLITNNLGVVHFWQNDLDGAEALYRKALAHDPGCSEALSNLSTILRLKGNLEEAIFYCRNALFFRPDDFTALNNLGNALKDNRQHDQAVRVYREALRFDPENTVVHKNLATTLLSLGRYDEGWREFEWRRRSDDPSRKSLNVSQPEWQGESVSGGTILIHDEQGFGDNIQFCRYAPLVKERGFHVVILMPAPLKRLIASLDGVDRVVTDLKDAPPFDFHCPVMHLPLVFDTSVDTIPSTIPYLRPDPADLPGWRERIAALSGRALKVGLAWAGRSFVQSPDLVAADGKRSIAPSALAPLLDVPNVRFFSLQKEGMQAPSDSRMIDWMSECRDFADTAALIMNLDLVISVDTAVVHLAGALGKPVWLLNRFSSCWRWFINREDSPWYPGVLRIFNQQHIGEWDEVVARVRDALTEISRES
jgi:Flp pilus assembly protein TadD